MQAPGEHRRFQHTEASPDAAWEPDPQQARLVPEVATTPYFPALDGLRAIAVLMVLMVHTVGSLCPWGWMGVQVFFVLSGFLITGILFDARETRHRARNFYGRRALRIFPLYYAVLLICLLILATTHGEAPRHFWLWFVSLQNFAPYLPGKRLFPDLVITGGAYAVGSVGHLWSLAVEDQFYLLWPWVVFGIGSRRALMRICFALIVARLVLGAALQHLLPGEWLSAGVIYRMLPTQCDGFLMGGLFALWLRAPHAPERRRNPQIAAAGPLAAGAIALYAALLAVLHRCPGLTGGNVLEYTSGLQAVIGMPLVNAVALCVLIAVVQPGTWAFRVCRWAPLHALGRVSYGFYVYHAFVIVVLRPEINRVWGQFALPGAGLAVCVATGAVTAAVSFASYRWLERPFLRLKGRFTAVPPGQREAASRPLT